MAERKDGFEAGEQSTHTDGHNATKHQAASPLLAVLEDLQRRVRVNTAATAADVERSPAFGLTEFEIIRRGLALSETPFDVSDVSPSHGSTAGGTIVTITGRDFFPGATVTFGARPSTSVAVLGTQEVHVLTPPGPEGPVDVIVTMFGGAEWLPGAFTYTKA